MRTVVEVSPNESHDSPFDIFTPARLQSPTLERLWQEAYGDDYPDGVRPNGFYSKRVLARVVDSIGAAQDQLLVDSVCGHGGAGLWIAQQLDMRLIGHDPSKRSIDIARERAEHDGLGGRSTFSVGDLASLTLPTAAGAALINMDVLLFIADKPAFLAEAARIVRPGGVFAFTTWEQAGYSDRLKATQLDDHRPMLAAAGFEVEFHQEPTGWRRQQDALLRSMITEEKSVADDVGEAAAHAFAQMARGGLDDNTVRRYVLVVARRR